LWWFCSGEVVGFFWVVGFGWGLFLRGGFFFFFFVCSLLVGVWLFLAVLRDQLLWNPPRASLPTFFSASGACTSKCFAPSLISRQWLILGFGGWGGAPISPPPFTPFCNKAHFCLLAEALSFSFLLIDPLYVKPVEYSFLVLSLPFPDPLRTLPTPAPPGSPYRPLSLPARPDPPQKLLFV